VYKNRNAIENVSDWSYKKLYNGYVVLQKNYIIDISIQTRQIAETNGVNEQSALTC